MPDHDPTDLPTGPFAPALQTTESEAARPRVQRSSSRRVVYDRRRLIRFDADRRAGIERRAGVEPWAIP